MNNRALNKLIRNEIAKHYNVDLTRTFSDSRKKGSRVKFCFYPLSGLTQAIKDAILKDVQQLIVDNGLQSTHKVSWGVNALWQNIDQLTIHITNKV